MARNGRQKSVADTLLEIEARVGADDLLTAEEKEKTLEKAREHVAKKRKDKAMDDLLDAAIKEEERRHDPEQQYEEVFVDLPTHAAFIRLDGVQFFHGLEYTVTYGVARTMYEIMSRAWQHENEIKGRKRNSDIFIRPKQVALRPGMEAMSAGNINKSSLPMTREQH